MVRDIILEFLSAKHFELTNKGYIQMTLCQFGSNYPNGYLKLIKKDDELKVFHIKEPRIYEKDLNFTVIQDTILSMLFEGLQTITFNKRDLQFCLKDPFYQKDLREINFEALQLIPIIKDKIIEGALLIYFDQVDSKVDFSNNELLKLLNRINEEASNDFSLLIEDKIIKAHNPLNNEYLILAIVNNQAYLNNNLMDYLKIKDNYLNLKNNEKNNLVQKFIHHYAVEKLIIDKITIYYLPLKSLNNEIEDFDLRAFYGLNEHQFNDHYSYLFIKKSPFDDTLKEAIKRICNWLIQYDKEYQYKLYEYNDEAFIMLIDNIINNKQHLNLKDMIKDDYIILLTTENEITSNMNLKRLSNYLYETQPEVFNYQDYIVWLNKINKDKLIYDDEYQKNHEYHIVNADNQKCICDRVLLPLRKNLRDHHFLSFNRVSEKYLEKNVKEEETNFFISLTISSLKKRRIYELIKKYLMNNNHLWLNILIDNQIDSDDLLRLISKYKQMNVNLVCDSSLYLDYEQMITLDLFDGIYVQDKEYQSLINHEMGLPQAILTYFIKDYKTIFIENFKPNKEIDYTHPSCYFIVKK